jgi:hypothetical protein
VIPLGGMIMAAGYADRIYKVRTVSDGYLSCTDTFPLRFKIAVDVLCNIVNGHVIYATVA